MADRSRSIADLIEDHWETQPSYPVERGVKPPWRHLEPQPQLGYGDYEDMSEHERTPDEIMMQRRDQTHKRLAYGGRLQYRDGGSPSSGRNGDDRTRDHGRLSPWHDLHQFNPRHPGEYDLTKPTPRHWNRKPWNFYSKAAAGGRIGFAPGGRLQSPFASDVQRTTYVGPNAQGVDLEKLKEAQRAIASGQNPEEVRQRTGWHNHMGKWWSEISDQDAKWVKPFTKEPQKLGDIWQHEKLYNAYPELKDLPVYLGDRGLPSALKPWRKLINPDGVQDDERAVFNPSPPRILIHPNWDKPVPEGVAREDIGRQLLAHEPQHWIQHREGVPGSNRFQNAIGLGTPPEQLEGQAYDVNVRQMHNLNDEQRRQTPPAKSMDLQTGEFKYRRGGRLYADGGRQTMPSNSYRPFWDNSPRDPSPALTSRPVDYSTPLGDLKRGAQSIWEGLSIPNAMRAAKDLPNGLRQSWDALKASPRLNYDDGGGVPMNAWESLALQRSYGDPNDAGQIEEVGRLPYTWWSRLERFKSSPKVPPNVIPGPHSVEDVKRNIGESLFNVEERNKAPIADIIRPQPGVWPDQPPPRNLLPTSPVRRIPITQSKAPPSPSAEILRPPPDHPASKWYDPGQHVRSSLRRPPEGSGGELIPFDPNSPMGKQFGGMVRNPFAKYADGGFADDPAYDQRQADYARQIADAKARAAEAGQQANAFSQPVERGDPWAPRMEAARQWAMQGAPSSTPFNSPPSSDEERENYWRSQDVPALPPSKPSGPQIDPYSQEIYEQGNFAPMVGGLGAGKIGRARPFGEGAEPSAPANQTMSSEISRGPYSSLFKLPGELAKWAFSPPAEAPQPPENVGAPAASTGRMRSRSSGIFSDTPMAESAVQSLANIIPDWMVTGTSSQGKLSDTNEWLRSQGLPFSVKNSLNIPQRPDPWMDLPPDDPRRQQQLHQRKLTAAQGMFDAATGLPVPPFYLNHLPFAEEDAIKSYMKGDYGSLAGIIGGVTAPVAGRMLWPIKNMASSPFGRRDPEGFWTRHSPFQARDIMPVDTSRWEVKIKPGSPTPEISRNRATEWEVFEKPSNAGQPKKVLEFKSQHWGPSWHGNQQWLEVTDLKPVGSYQVTPEMFKAIQPQVANTYPQAKGFIDQKHRIAGATKRSPEYFAESPMQKYELPPEQISGGNYRHYIPFEDIPGGTIPGFRHQNPFSLTKGLDPGRYRYQRLTTPNDPAVRELFDIYRAERGTPAPITQATPSSWDRMKSLFERRKWTAPEATPQIPEGELAYPSVSPLRTEAPNPMSPMERAGVSGAASGQKSLTYKDVALMAKEAGVSTQEMVSMLEKRGLYQAPRADGGRISQALARNYNSGGAVGYRPFWHGA